MIEVSTFVYGQVAFVSDRRRIVLGAREALEEGGHDMIDTLLRDGSEIFLKIKAAAEGAGYNLIRREINDIFIR